MSPGFTEADLDAIALRRRIRGSESEPSIGGDRDDFDERLRTADESYAPPRGDLTRPVIEAMGEYQHLEDVGHVRVALAGAATAVLDGDPLWLMLVGGPSSGKTEDLRALDGLARSVDEVTRAGLLGWTGSGKTGRVSGLLTRIGKRGLATVADFSTLLAGDHTERDRTFAALRRIYDGRYVRNLGQIGQPLVWEGRLTLLAAVTGAVDNYSSHADALGPRWVYCRIPEFSAEGKRRAARLSRDTTGSKAKHRDEVCGLATAAIAQASKSIAEKRTPDALAEKIITAAIVATQARAGVPRSGYGKREVLGEVVREEPMRLAGQLEMLTRGLLALRVPTVQVTDLVRRCALDSIDQTRRAALAELVTGEVITVNGMATRLRCDWHVADRALEDLRLIGLVADVGQGHEGNARHGRTEPRSYRLHGEYAELVKEAFL